MGLNCRITVFPIMKQRSALNTFLSISSSTETDYEIIQPYTSALIDDLTKHVHAMHFWHRKRMTFLLFTLEVGTRVT